jgi:hypothetical protein
LVPNKDRIGLASYLSSAVTSPDDPDRRIPTIIFGTLVKVTQRL